MVWHTSDDYWDCRGSTLFLWAPHWPKSSQAKKPYPIKATDTGICIEKQKEHFKSQKRQWKKQCNIWTASYWSDVSVFAQCELWRGPDKLQLWHPVPSDNYEPPPHQTGFALIILSVQHHHHDDLPLQVGYHVYLTFFPSMVFVSLAWLSLFISVESVPGRVSMGMTTLLTVTAMFGSVRQNVPR